MKDVHQAAVNAAQRLRADFPDVDAPFVVTVSCEAHVLVMTSPSPELAYALGAADAACPLCPSLSVTLAGEAYTRTAEAEEPEPAAGSIAEAFGADPRVVACVTVATAYRGYRRPRMTVVRYTNVGGLVVFGNRVDGDLAPDGQVGEALLTAIRWPVDVRARLLDEVSCLVALAEQASGWGFECDVRPFPRRRP